MTLSKETGEESVETSTQDTTKSLRDLCSHNAQSEVSPESTTVIVERAADSAILQSQLHQPQLPQFEYDGDLYSGMHWTGCVNIDA